jgi:signal transduction histidine kinase
LRVAKFHGVTDDVRSEDARRKSAEEALAAARDLMQRAVAAIERGELAVEDFAQTTAKQLQPPLAAVRAFARALRTQSEPQSAETFAFADRIDAEAAYVQAQIAEQLAKGGQPPPAE